MKSKSLTIECDNLSCAWSAALIAACRAETSALVPLTVIVNLPAGEIQEDDDIRKDVDSFLSEYTNIWPCDTTPNLIFPENQWNRNLPKEILFDRYKKVLPRLRRHSANRKGIYFERMISFGPEKRNQLKHVIENRLSGNPRVSALQVCICDPQQDQTNQRQRGFPCLQLFNFVPGDKPGELYIVGTYATQWLVDRAYGNYLGLCRLGTFVAHELGMTLTKMICISPKAVIGTPTKGAARMLAGKLVGKLPKEVLAQC